MILRLLSAFVFALSGLGLYAGSITAGVSCGATTTQNMTIEANPGGDWAHWGDGGSTSLTPVNRKSGGGSTISSATRVVDTSTNNYTNDPRGLTWTDGTPTGSSTANTVGIYSQNANTAGRGFYITVPASAASRTVYLFLGMYSSGVQLTASLSDASASNYVDNTCIAGANTAYDANYTITYTANSSGQTLKLQFLTYSTDNTNANVTLCGAAVTGEIQNVLDTDTFGGTAGTVLHTYNAKWINSTMASICFDALISTGSSGVAANAGESCDYDTGQTWTDNQWAQMTLVAVPTHIAQVCVELQGASGDPEGYCFGSYPDKSSTEYILSDPKTGELTDWVQTPTAGDVMNIQIYGTGIICSINGIPLSPVYTASLGYSGGNPGLVVSNTENTKTLSTFSAGSVTVLATTAPVCTMTLLGAGPC